jgi:shikimate dehydrogenase
MSESVRAACVIGWPVAHSSSPIIHGYWLKRHGVAGAYRREAVRPEELAEFVAGLAGRGYVGANVTIPHKVAVMALTEPDERARAIGAANTLWLDGRRLRSTNTDAAGFVAGLDARAPGWDKDLADAVVVGAGGAGRAVVYGLVERGVGRVHVVNRTLARAEELGERFGAVVRPTPWAELPRPLAGAGLVVNATSLGMKGNPPLDVDLGQVRDGAVVADVVYVPLRTPLLAEARRRGLGTADGLDMLLHQARPGFRLWFGVLPEVTAELRRLVERELAER